MQTRLRRSLHNDETLVGAVLLVLIAASIMAWVGRGYYLDQGIFACRLSGYGALGLLAISILFGPILRAGSWIGLSGDWKVSARVCKNTGIASAVLALLHSAISAASYLQWNWREVLDDSFLYAGLLALVVMTLLLVFSVKPLMSQVGWQLWKPTFRLSFAAAALGFCHLLYAPFASLQWTLGLYGGALALFLLRFCPVRRPPSPLGSPESPDSST